LPELQGEPEEIAREKARIACKLSGKPVVVEDTSLCFNAMHGLPGPYIKDFLKKLGVQGVYDMVSHYKDHTGYAQVCVGYCEPGEEPHVFAGRVNCTVVPPGGSTRFLFDQILIPQGHTKRFSEMSMEEKNAISHRRRAFEKFKEWLEQNKQ
jgi:inosine triphosphate pyrophosphatase